MEGSLRSSWKIGTAIGLVFGLLNNADPISAMASSAVPVVALTISAGQLLLWWLIGLLLASRVVTTLAFRRPFGT